VDLHRSAIRFPRARFYSPQDLHSLIYPYRFEYVGLGQAGVEDASTYDRWTRDPYACLDQMLIDKRRERNPFRRRHGYEAAVTGVEGVSCLLSWCSTEGFDGLFGWALPWSVGFEVDEQMIGKELQGENDRSR
jgi:hypothetical protein